jgi:hypothetical protein
MFRKNKTVALEWGAFMSGKVVEKKHVVKRNFNADTALKVAGVVTAAVMVVHGAPVFASPDAITTIATDPSFQAQISAATKPIKDVIFGFAGEVYFVFMAWGALEALIGKPQQGFTRMKTATAAYILLYWIPTIVQMVNKVRPAVGY